MMRTWTIGGVAAATLTLAACGGTIDYEVAGEERVAPDEYKLVIDVPAGSSDDELRGVLDDLWTDRVNDDYEIRLRCPDGREAAYGFLRNSTDERELRRISDC